MRLDSKHIRNFFVVGLPKFYQTGAMFLRGVVLAHMLSVHEFGLSVIIIAVSGAIDLLTDAGVDRFIVQHRFGHRQDLLRTTHTFCVVGGAVFGLGIAALSYPLALLFGAPQIWPAIAATGGIALIRGFINLSYKVQQRDHEFAGEAILELTTVTADLAVTVAVAYFTHGYGSALAGIYANAIVVVVASHLIARGRYGCWPRPKLMRLVGRFSAPIYLNAPLLFAAMQGDRMIVASVFSKEKLALYAVSCAIGQGIATLSEKAIERILLPFMAPRRGDRPALRRRVNQIGAAIITLSFLFLLGVSLFSPWLTGLLYGRDYTGIRAVVAAAGIFQMIQIQQAWMNSVVMGSGATTAFPKITVMRAAALPCAIFLARTNLSLAAIPLAFAVASAASLVMSFQLVRPLRLIDGRLFLASLAGIVVALVTVGGLIWTGRMPP